MTTTRMEAAQKRELAAELRTKTVLDGGIRLECP